VQVNGGTLQGIGAVGPISMTASTAGVAPGGSPGILTCGNFGNNGDNGILNVELDGAAPGTGYDQLNVLGTVNLAGVRLNGTLNFASATNDQFAIINNNGRDAVLGTFNGLPQDGTLYVGGQLFQISYTGGTGNDVVLTHLATPSSPTLAIQSAPPTSIRLLWATNNPPFSLQVCTDLAAASWTAASPAPAVVGGQNVVTNSIAGGQQFYRLSNP
jgi:hypothetical protein